MCVLRRRRPVLTRHDRVTRPPAAPACLPGRVTGRREVDEVAGAPAKNGGRRLLRICAAGTKGTRRAATTLTILIVLASIGDMAAARMTGTAAAAPDTTPPPAVGGAAAPWLEVGEVLRLAAEQSQSAVEVAARTAQAEADLQSARAAWWPTVDLEAQYNLRDNPVLIGAQGFSFASQEQQNLEYRISARELVWNGGRRGLAITAATQRRDAVAAGGLATLQQDQLDALDAYLSVLELAGTTWVIDQRLASLDVHLASAQDLYEHGLVARNDVLETEVRTRQVQDQRAAVIHQQEVARQELNRRLGRDPLTPVALPDSLGAPPALPGDRAALLEVAAHRNPSLRAAELQFAAHRTAVELARRAWWPTLFVSAYHAYTENATLIYPHVNAVAAGVSWDIFDGGARAADTRSAEAGLTVAARGQVEAQRAVTVAVDAAWRQWVQARREEATARSNVASATENLRIVSDQYGAGVSRSSDVLDAETLLAESRHDVVSRHYDTYRAQAALLAAAGWDLVDFYTSRGTPGEER